MSRTGQAIPREPTMYCINCAYALDGLTRNRCPECARPFDPHDAATYRTCDSPRRSSLCCLLTPSPIGIVIVALLSVLGSLVVSTIVLALNSLL